MATFENDGNRIKFADAVADQLRVRGYTHDMYRYPARFSPTFARAAIQAFSNPGEVVLDPFMGGGTTLVEACLQNRHVVGSDISSLAVFLARAKTTAITDDSIAGFEQWFERTLGRLNAHRKDSFELLSCDDKYTKNLPWSLKRAFSQYLSRITLLQTRPEQQIARCVLLRAGQLAVDCQRQTAGLPEFRLILQDVATSTIAAVKEFGTVRRGVVADAGNRSLCRCLESPAEKLRLGFLQKLGLPKPTLVVTSPPYPGVHVLYHRWNVRGRRESPAPFWIAGCVDGKTASKYTLGDRHQKGLRDYFAGITDAYTNLRTLVADGALVVQMVAFPDRDAQLPLFLAAMNQARFREVSPQELKIDRADRLWRDVPGRQWYAAIRGNLETAKEVVLFHCAEDKVRSLRARFVA